MKSATNTNWSSKQSACYMKLHLVKGLLANLSTCLNVDEITLLKYNKLDIENGCMDITVFWTQGSGEHGRQHDPALLQRGHVPAVPGELR